MPYLLLLPAMVVILAVVLVPLLDNGHVNAVLELGFDNTVPARVRDLFDRLGDRLGIALRSVQYRAQMHELLEETRRQAEEIINLGARH